MRLMLTGFALLAAVAASPSLAVETVTITSAGIYDPGTAAATVGGVELSEYAVPLTFTASVGKSTTSFLGFCVDLPHIIYVGIGSQLRETLGYHVAALASNGFGKSLGRDQVREITGLAALGFGIAKNTATDKAAQLAGIQQAIWTVEYPTSTFVATGPYATAQASYAAAFVKAAPTLKGFARTIVSDDGNTQAQITNVGGVPEPATWALLLAGFGTVGLAARRRGTMATVSA